MRFFILHADADKAAAEELRDFLKTRGPMPELDDGSRTRFLQPSDVLIALWSQKAVFSPYRMQIEKRMLDAWADEQLVLVKLDHGFLPVGLRDLPVIDAGFASGRALQVWPKVERAAKEAMNAALVARQREQASVPSSTPSRSAPSRSVSPRPAGDVSSAKSGGGGGCFGIAVLILLGLGALNLWGGALSSDVLWGLLALAVVLLVVLVGVAVTKVLGGGGKSPKRRAPEEAQAGNAALETMDRMMADAPAAAPAPAPASTTLFISYAHADTTQVEPVVKVVEASGRTVWIDKGGIKAGQGWAGEIVRGIKGAKGVLVMCSPRAFESDHIKREVYLADRYKKPMLPVFIEAASPPEDFEYFFASVQWLELFKLPEAERAGAVTKALAAV